MKFTAITITVDKKLDTIARKLEKLGETMDIKIIASMVWHPHGVVVIVGHEEKAQPKKATKIKPRRPKVLPTESALQKPSE